LGISRTGSLCKFPEGCKPSEQAAGIVSMSVHFYPHEMEDVCIQEQGKARKSVTVAFYVFFNISIIFFDTSIQ